MGGFPKGKSGNPGGQTKAQAAARRLAADLVHERTNGGLTIIEFACTVLDSEDWDQKSRRWACEFLANRLWGRSPLVVEVQEQDGAGLRLPDLRDLLALPLAELRRGAAVPVEPEGNEPAPEEPSGDGQPGDAN